MNNESLNPPEKDKIDHVHTIVKAAASSIPIVGGMAAEFFTSLIASPIEKKREKWFELVAMKLSLLEEMTDGFSIEIYLVMKCL